MKSNFFNPEKMISNTSQKIVMGILYTAIIGMTLLVGLWSFSIINLSDGNFTSILFLDLNVIIIGIGIWWHEVSKPITKKPLPELNKDEFMSFEDWRSQSFTNVGVNQ